MDQHATREVLWNIGTLPNVVAMYAFFLVALAVGTIGLLRRIEFWSSGKPSAVRQSLVSQLINLITYVILQRKVIKSPSVGLAHTLVYSGFIVLICATTMVALQHDLGLPVFIGKPYLIISFLSDILGFGVIVGCLVFAHRRYVQRPDLIHSRPADFLLLGSLVLLCFQGFILEGLRIRALGDPWSAYTPVGTLLANLFWGLSPNAVRVLHYLMWWWHAISVFLVIAIAPYTKFLHVIASSLNLVARDFNRPAGALPFPGDLEKLMESGEEFSLGLGTIKDYSWRQLLELEACTSCGRCQDACPAYNSGKPLSPKWMILDSRNHALALHNDGQLKKSRLPDTALALDRALNEKLYFPTHGMETNGKGYQQNGEFKAANTLVQKSARAIGESTEHRIASEVMDPDVFWSCTTCMACVQACPVGINHVDQIVENRRNMALMHGEIPQEAQATLRALENRANPYGDPNERAKWSDGLPVKILKPGDSVDYLYWVGCVSAYDQRKQKIARALVSIMNHAGLSFGILGNAECCTGDPARRLGEENIFQGLAKKNIATLQNVKFKFLVANCPHCFNSIAREYPQIGAISSTSSPEVIHHTELIQRLLTQGKLSLKDGDATGGDITFHDPCYLGRYNKQYDAPRDTLKAVKGLRILEMKESRESAMCCGAGGGHFWMDLKIGERVNVRRTNQAAATGAGRVATGCPFCMQMMEDGIKLTNRESSMDVRDIAEVIADRL